MPAITRLQRMNRGSQFRAFVLRGDAQSKPIDPFLGVDHAWTSGATFPPHPHAGFSAVSYLFLDSETGIANRDSLGNQNLIRPGGLHWTAAGRGVIHEEVPAEDGKMVHMLQIFVNLSAEKQAAPPFVLSLEPGDVPVVHLNGATVRVPLGRFEDAISPVTPPTEVRLLDIALDAGHELRISIPEGHVAFVLPVGGELWVDGQLFNLSEPTAPVDLPGSADRMVVLKAMGVNARAVMFSGVPLNQPVFWHGPLAMASPSALVKALESYNRGDFGEL
ncbi:pirin family protein [Pseudomonas sp. NPDC090208]|uniref:pirin family protein n=1 Tax=Pseudomonas sp. NPDC090208 TaxID=3364478 RepID=UPI003809EE20